MENLLQGFPNVCVYIDDILVSGTSEADHMLKLEQVLSRLQSAGITLQQSNCTFATTSVEYLGHIIDSTGLHPSPTKVQAIKKAPAPKNITELRAFLGLVNYYHKFLPNLSSTLSPLHLLLCKGTKWNWTQNQQASFDKVKELLQSSALLVHFDSKKPLLVYADATPYGIGAVLAHKIPDNSEKPIAFASRTLAPAEHNYSQLEKEVLATIFAVKRFHQYLYVLIFHYTQTTNNYNEFLVNLSKFLHWPQQEFNVGHSHLLHTSTRLSTNQGRVCPQLMPSVDYLSKLL